MSGELQREGWAAKDSPSPERPVPGQVSSSQAAVGQPVMPGDPPVQPTIVDPLPDPARPDPVRPDPARPDPGRKEAPPVQPDRPVRREPSQADESSQERQQ